MHLVGAFGCRHLDGEQASVGLDALVGMCGCVDLDGILVSEGQDCVLSVNSVCVLFGIIGRPFQCSIRVTSLSLPCESDARNVKTNINRWTHACSVCVMASGHCVRVRDILATAFFVSLTVLEGQGLPANIPFSRNLLQL